MKNYNLEVKQRWGETTAYKEYEQKTANYTQDQWQDVNDGLMTVLAKFAECMKDGHTADSAEAQALVKELQNYITENYYTCTNEIFAGLGQIYVADERFKNNIDKHARRHCRICQRSHRHFLQKIITASTKFKTWSRLFPFRMAEKSKK